MPPSPNLLFLVVDSLRYDAALGDATDTPTLDRLREDGVTFSNCFSQGISTAPAMTAMLTGRYPLEYGGHWYVAASQPTFAEQFSRAGYRTGAIHSNPYVSSARNFDKGFDTFSEDVVAFEPDSRFEGFPDKLLRLASRASRIASKTPYTPITEVNDRLLDWIDDAPGPWFLWTQYMDVHGPYLPGGEFTYRNKFRAEWLWRKAAVRDPDGITDAEQEELRRNYHREVEFLDRELGNLLDTLDGRGVLDDTAVVLVADHGDEFYEHGWYGHRNLPYDELTHVPLIVRFPDGIVDVEPPHEVDDLVRCVDIFPTLCDTLGVDLEDEMRTRMAGESLLSPIEEDTPPSFDAAVTEKKVWGGDELRFGFRTGRWKYLYDGTDGTSRLYDLEADPDETRDVEDDHPDVAAQFRDRLRDRLDRIERTSEDVVVPDVEEGAGVQERLRALGYRE